MEGKDQLVLKQGDLLTQAIELDEILTTDTESQHTFVIVRHYGGDDDRDLPSWEKGNTIHNEMSPAASLILDDSLDVRYISAKRKEVDSSIPKHLGDMFERPKGIFPNDNI